MSKGDNRLKILYVLDELKVNSSRKREDDDDRFLSATLLIDTLNEKYNLNADRKSIYSYVESLIKYGYDIEKSRRGYYLREHYNREEEESSFELPEVKLMADALYASRFISAKKKKSIIKKLDMLIPEEHDQLQNRRVYLENAVKSDNSSVIYSIDAIHQAVSHNKKISFIYQTVIVNTDSSESKLLDVNKTDEDGNDKIYIQSPFALVWKNEYYYVLCYDSEQKSPKTFRVDRMKDVCVLEDESREGIKYFDEINITEYANTAFSMFGGETINIVLRVKKDIARVVTDRFGKGISVYKDDDDDYFRCSVYVQKSDQFYSWLSGFGRDIELVFPNSVRNDYVEYLTDLVDSYK